MEAELKDALSSLISGANTREWYDEELDRILEKYGLQQARSSTKSALSRSNSIVETPSPNVEILVHNVAHSDLVCSVNKTDLSLPKCRVMARPKFSHFREITENILQAAETQAGEIDILKLQKFSRRAASRSNSITDAIDADATADNNANTEYTTAQGGPLASVGFDFKCSPIQVDKASALRFRSDDHSALSTDSDNEKASNDPSTSPKCVIDAAYFPMAAVLVPKWLQEIESTGRGGSRCLIILITGRGTPVDASANVQDNSTYYTGRLITSFIERVFPAVEVIQVDSATNLFRYDENIVFVKRELLPLIDSIRNNLSEKVGEKWREMLHVTLSFADGSSARISAINASLRHYRPSYMHFWRLKTFWRENKVCDDDIECHSYEEISTVPAINIDSIVGTDPNVALVIAEMMKFIEDFAALQNSVSKGSRESGDGNALSDMQEFWLRKTKKPVLAVLLVQKPGQPPKLYRGTNMEVSMPTGSLCAERNVIGTALADDVSLSRRDLQMIAVYSARKMGGSSHNSSGANRNKLDSSDSIPRERADSASSHISAFLRTTSPLRPNSTINSPVYTNTPKRLHVEKPPVNGDVCPIMNGSSNGETSGSNGSPEMLSISPATLPNSSQPSDRSTTPNSAMKKMFKVGKSTLKVNVEETTTGESGEDTARSPMVGQKRKIMRLPSVNSSSHLNSMCPTPNHSGKAFPPQTGMREPLSSSANKQESASSQYSTGKRNVRILQNSDAGTRPLANVIMNPNRSPRAGSVEDASKAEVGDLYASLNGAEGALPCSCMNGTCMGVCGVIGTSDSKFHDSNGKMTVTQQYGAYQHPYQYGMLDLGVTTITVDEGDLNPLKPCGACHEWLKKIAEVKPQFSVVTFTDYSCEGVYIEEIHD